MNKDAFLTHPARQNTELAEGFGSAGTSFSLTIKADDGSTILDADVDYMHQAFQRLLDWSVDQVEQDVCAVITGPNGFDTKHRIKAHKSSPG